MSVCTQAVIAIDIMKRRLMARPSRAYSSFDPLYGRRLPRAIGDLLLWHVQSQRELERAALRCGQPVPRLVAAWRVTLDIDGQRAVRIAFHVAAIAKRVPIDGVVDEVGIVVVHGQRPERVNRRDLVL